LRRWLRTPRGIRKLTNSAKVQAVAANVLKLMDGKVSAKVLAKRIDES